MHKIIFFISFLFILAACGEKSQNANTTKAIADLSIEELDSLIALDAENVEYLTAYGEKLLEEFRGDEALPALAKAFRLNSKDVHIKQLYASALINRMDKSVSEVETAIEKL